MDDPPPHNTEPVEAGTIAPPQPDIMNDAAFKPPQPSRRNTISSEGGSVQTDTCRICRSEGTPDEPLFYPCKCSGSIKFVHQECLMEWLSHSHKKHCELCKTPFRFTKLYDANMPQTLPWNVFIRRACWHIVLMIVRGCRTALVGFVWLGMIPWLIRWVWRWFFWIADAAWAREAFMHMMEHISKPAFDGSHTGARIAHSFLEHMGLNVQRMLPGASNVAVNISAPEPPVNAFTWPQADPSILSSWSYLASLTPNTRANRLILDVFEGQLITCVIITGFILVFLIREWVVQQQPLVNLDNVQQQLREAAERVQADNERLRRQQELLEQARARLIELQNETENYVNGAAGFEAQDASPAVEFMSWDAVESLIDKATGHLRSGGEAEHGHFLSCAATVTKQIRAQSRAGGGVEELCDKVFHKLETLPEDERKEWESVLVSEIKKLNAKKLKRNIGTDSRRSDLENKTGESSLEARITKLSPSSPLADKRQVSADLMSEIKKAREETQRHHRAIAPSNSHPGADVESAEASTGRSRRPPIGDRDFSSRATHIQRLLTEAEEVFNTSRGESSSARQEDGQAANDTPCVISAPSSESWQEVTPPNEPSQTTTPAPTSTMDWKKTTIPITNAGPDAKINIRWSGTSRAPEGLKIQEKMLDVDEKLLELKDELAKETEEGSAAEPTPDKQGAEQGEQNPGSAQNNPFHPDGPEPEQRDNESFGNRVAEAVRGELGLEDVEDFEQIDREEADPENEPVPVETQSVEIPAPRPETNPPTRWERLADWFWGDIQAPNAPEAAPAAEEERQEGDAAQPAQVAPFVLAQGEQPAPNDAQQAEAQQEQHQNDPEVVAAAQQAGIDPEAIEDAEDLEGIFELIGLQGPLIGLFQTSAFCLLLVACTILGAVILPYLGGKGVLSLVGSPVYFLLQLPLQVASFVVDFLIDTTLVVLAVIAIVAALAVDFGLAGVQTWMPSLGDRDITEQIIAYCTTTMANAANRLQGPLSRTSSIDDWGWAFLRWSVHSHASLRTIQGEVDGILHSVGAVITWVVETVSSGSVLAVCKEALCALMDVSWVSESILAGVNSLQDQARPLISGLSGIMRGTLTFSNSEAHIDPSLVYWDSTDRALAILTGYIALAALAAIYVAADTPITKSEAGQKTEKTIRDTLRQAGGVFKVILIISIEMLVFPLYCGLLLDIAFLPLFKNADVASRWAFAGRKPTLFCFIHWFVGTCYMFHFALFVGMCRKILRKGVLWFIRDPDDPTFHPVRDVLERNVATQLRKIAFSALVYGALVILCLGGVIWTIGHAFDDIFPIHWVSTEPILEFPLDMLLYNFVTPIVIRLMKPSDTVSTMYAWWLRKCARALRLSHFLFDDRRKDEEGHFVHQSWSTFLLMKEPSSDGAAATGEDRLADDAHFKKDGTYVLTPCNDQYRPPKSEEAFFHLDENDACIVDKDGKKNEHFAKVYIPPLFRIRVSLFMICLWLFSAFAGLCSTLVPLMLGRYLLSKFMPDGLRVSDIYAYSLGAYIVGGILFAALKGKATAAYIKSKASIIDARAWVGPMKRFSIRALKCMYVYGFLGVMLPTVFALFLQFYVVLPLHTWAASVAATTASDSQLANNATSAVVANFTRTFGPNATQGDNQLGSVVEHTFHVFQDYTLGLLYVRVFGRMIVATPASRAAEAFRRVTADGYLNPNVRLATRFFVLPASIIAALVLTAPPVLTKLAIVILRNFVSAIAMDEELETKLYRYSYPIAASIIVVILGTMEVGKATSRWRARIRDEAYLVGERLHNFGEKKPPPGSKSVVRKER